MDNQQLNPDVTVLNTSPSSNLKLEKTYVYRGFQKKKLFPILPPKASEYRLNPYYSWVAAQQFQNSDESKVLDSKFHEGKKVLSSKVFQKWYVSRHFKKYWIDLCTQ